MAVNLTMDIQGKLEEQRKYFQTGATKSYEFRLEQLKKLKSIIIKNEDAIFEALYKDLKKPKEEAWVAETGFILEEIKSAIKNLKHWMKRKYVSTNLLNFPSKSFIVAEPLGVTLIIGPWNYPIQLIFAPLIASIAAGNCAVVKVSEFAPYSASVVRNIISEFDEKYLMIVEGDGSVVVPEMLNNFQFDHIFYTGSTAVGKIIYELASKQLTPVTLELGGKSPCVIESDADLKITAKRIVSTKFVNAGQTCIAPDYLLVPQELEQQFLKELKSCCEKFYGGDLMNNDDYSKIINEKHFDRLMHLIHTSNVVFGGENNRENLFIAPTIISNPNMDDPIMKEEIFGPLLPVLTYKTREEAKAIIEKNKNPLSFYLFTKSKKLENEWINDVAFGTGGINVVTMQITNLNLPFGGRGNSGIGAYHHKKGFDTFSHHKGIMKTPWWPDLALKYPPFKGKLNLFKKIFG